MFSTLFKSAATIRINDRDYVGGKDLVISKGKVMIDGEDVSMNHYSEKTLNITIHGNCESVSSMSGNVTIHGNIHGDVDTMSGKVTANTVKGSIETMSGRITIGDVAS
jgi:calcineurin-like phosphoesterase family protein